MRPCSELDARVLRRAENHDRCEILDYLGKPVYFPGRDIDNRAWPHDDPVTTGLQYRPPGRDQVNLVLGMRLLVVGAASWDRIRAHAEIGYPQMLDPAHAGSRAFPRPGEHLHQARTRIRLHLRQHAPPSSCTS